MPKTLKEILNYCIKEGIIVNCAVILDKKSNISFYQEQEVQELKDKLKETEELLNEQALNTNNLLNVREKLQKENEELREKLKLQEFKHPIDFVPEK